MVKFVLNLTREKNENEQKRPTSGRHCSVVSSVPTILRPQVRIPSTPSMLFFNFYYCNCNQKRTKINQKWPFLQTKKRPGLPHFFNLLKFYANVDVYLKDVRVVAVQHPNEKLEPDGLPEPEPQHGQRVGDLLVAVGQVAQTGQQLKRQNSENEIDTLYDPIRRNWNQFVGHWLI